MRSHHLRFRDIHFSTLLTLHLRARKKYTMYFLPVIAVITAYVLAVRALRYRRRDGFQRRFPQYKTREEMASLPLSDAASIMRELSEREFPITFYTSVSFALFKVSQEARSSAEIGPRAKPSADVWDSDDLQALGSYQPAFRRSHSIKTSDRHRRIDVRNHLQHTGLTTQH